MEEIDLTKFGRENDIPNYGRLYGYAYGRLHGSRKGIHALIKDLMGDEVNDYGETDKQSCLDTSIRDIRITSDKDGYVDEFMDAFNVAFSTHFDDAVHDNITPETGKADDIINGRDEYMEGFEDGLSAVTEAVKIHFYKIRGKVEMSYISDFRILYATTLPYIQKLVVEEYESMSVGEHSDPYLLGFAHGFDPGFNFHMYTLSFNRIIDTRLERMGVIRWYPRPIVEPAAPMTGR